MTQKKTRTILIIGIAVAVTVIAVIVINKTKKTGLMQAPGKRGGSSVVSVRSEEATIQTLNDYVITNGEVESQSAIEVFPSMNGKIASINVMLGSHVNKGDVIAKVDPSEPGTKYALSPVEAPISGSIVSSPSKVGEKVSTSTSITMIGDIENLQISAPVPERYVAELKPGLKAEVTLEAYPGIVFSATVSRVSPVVDAATRTKEIILNFDKKDSRINAGMFAKVKLYTSKYAGQIAIPKDSLVSQNDDSYLFVVNDDSTGSKRLVKTGKTVDNLIQITDNLVTGERVVVEGMLSLSDGARVNDIAQIKQPDAQFLNETAGKEKTAEKQGGTK